LHHAANASPGIDLVTETEGKLEIVITLAARPLVLPYRWSLLRLAITSRTWKCLCNRARLRPDVNGRADEHRQRLTWATGDLDILIRGDSLRFQSPSGVDSLEDVHQSCTRGETGRSRCRTRRSLYAGGAGHGPGALEK